MLEKLLGTVFILVAGLLVWTEMGLKEADVLSNFRKQTFSQFVSEDLKTMRENKLLPKEWESIQYTAYNFNSDFQRHLVRDEKIKIPEAPSGQNRLEIEFIDVPDEETPSIILQMSLFDLASNNKIWELGKAYPILPFIKKVIKNTNSSAPDKGQLEGNSKTSISK